MDEHQREVGQAIQEGLQAGLSLIWPNPDGSKRPDGAWKEFQERRQSREEMLETWGEGRNGIMCVCGKVSGGLECLDFESADIYATFQASMSLAGEEDLLERVESGYQERCPRGGYHLPYRCEVVGGNQKLAFDENLETLIETRGEGGCFMAAPTRLNGSAWTRMRGGFATIATVTVEERDTLHRIARLLCRAPVVNDQRVYEPKNEPERQDRPGDDFNRRGAWEFLVEVGCTLAGGIGEQQYWRRANKDWSVHHGHSAVLHLDSQFFVPFSSSMGFPQTEVGYSKYRTLTYLRFSGDFSKASSWLRKQGFGKERVEVPRIEYGQIMRANLLGSIELPEISTLPILGREGFFIEGGSNLLYGFPKVGKTDLSVALIQEWIEQGRRVCYFSEEPLLYWKARLGAIGKAWDFWEPLLMCEAMGWGVVKLLDNFTTDDVVFVDTIRSVAGYRENKVDEDVGRVIEPMILAAREKGSTLIAGFHARKMPGDDGMDISGHHSLFGAFDRALQLKRMAGDDNERKRKLTVFGRMLDPQQSSSLVYEMTDLCRFRPLDKEEATKVLDLAKKCAECGADFAVSRRDKTYCGNTCAQRAARKNVSGKSDGE